MEQVIALSKQLWTSMQEKDIEFLRAHTYEDTVFVHMGVTLRRDEELEVIKQDIIQYKYMEIEDVAISQIQSTIILLTKMRLTAVVGGNEVINPFVVTEVYTEYENQVILVSLSYTRINY